MSPSTKHFLDPFQGSRDPLCRRFAPQLETSFPVPRAVVREAQKIERLRPAQPSPAAVGLSQPAEFDEPGLVRVQGQFKACEPLHQIVQESLRVLPMLKTHHEVVGITDQNRLAFGFAGAPFLLEPQVEDVMQVDVRQDR